MKLFLFLLLPIYLFAQHGNTSLQIGIDGGYLLLNSFDFNRVYDGTRVTPRIAATTYINYAIPHSKFGVRLGVRYSWTNMEVYEENRPLFAKGYAFPRIRYKNNHVELPLHMTFQIWDKEQVALQGYIGFMLAIATSKLNMEYQEGTVYTEYRGALWALDYDLQRTNYGHNYGLESGLKFNYELSQNVTSFLEGYYRMGLRQSITMQYLAGTRFANEPYDSANNTQFKEILYSNNGFFLNLGLAYQF